jgi:hypothetical protein
MCVWSGSHGLLCSRDGVVLAKMGWHDTLKSSRIKKSCHQIGVLLVLSVFAFRRFLSYSTHSVLSPICSVPFVLVYPASNRYTTHPRKKKRSSELTSTLTRKSANSDGTGIREWMCSLRSTTCVVTNKQTTKKSMRIMST